MFVKIINDEVVKYPYTFRDLKNDNPSTSFSSSSRLTDDDLLYYGVYRIEMTPKPSCNYNQIVREVTPTLQNGKWKQTWETVDLTEEEYNNFLLSTKESVRRERNNILKEYVDAMSPIRWESLTDEQKQNWRDYRQALLDVPEQANFPWEINWPDLPN